MLVTEVPALRRFWYPVATTDMVQPGPVPVMLLGESLVLWRLPDRGEVRAARDRCPHRGGVLSDGSTSGGCLVCPYHGWQWDERGACRLVPANGPGAAVPRHRLELAAAVERDGLVWVRLDDGPYGLPDWGEPATWGVRLVAFEQWHTAAPVFVENNLDVSHVPFVHHGTMGDPEHPGLPSFTVERTTIGLRFDISYSANVRGQLQDSTGLAGLIERKASVELLQPLAFRLDISYANGLRHVIHKVATPVDDATTLVVQVLSRNDEPADWTPILAADRAIIAEDRKIVERLPVDLPLDLTVNAHTRADRMTIEYRRLLTELCGVAPSAEAFLPVHTASLASLAER